MILKVKMTEYELIDSENKKSTKDTLGGKELQENAGRFYYLVVTEQLTSRLELANTYSVC